MKTATEKGNMVEELFKAGAHFGFVKARRHPSALPYIFGAKNKVEIFDLEKTQHELIKAKNFIQKVGSENHGIMIVGGKSEAKESVERIGTELNMPFVAGRWIGGTLTNFPEIKKRLAKLEELTGQREKGELAKYTKKERLLIDREIAKLTVYFGGISGMKGLPKALLVVDPKKEHIAVSEAKRMNIPVIGIAGTDNNLYQIDVAIPANDSSRQSVSFILGELGESYKEGLKSVKPEEPKETLEVK